MKALATIVSIWVPHLDALGLVYTALSHCDGGNVFEHAVNSNEIQNVTYGFQQDLRANAPSPPMSQGGHSMCSLDKSHLAFAFVFPIFVQSFLCANSWWAVLPHRMVQLPMLIFCWMAIEVRAEDRRAHKDTLGALLASAFVMLIATYYYECSSRKAYTSEKKIRHLEAKLNGIGVV